jgi:cyclopropane fatty-acyl-phospholipid synthase-like methyltransferase
MPFADGFFDAIISVDSYIYFGTDDLYLNYLQKFLAPGGTLGIVLPELMKDFEDGVPEHLKDFWGQDCWSWHTVDWWKKLWERTGLVDIKVAETMSEGCMAYVKWKETQDKVGKNPYI